jgi:hypothetical protein
MHVYVIDNYKCVPILLNLQKVDGATSDKLMENIVISLAKYRGVREVDLTQKLVYFGAYETIVF